MKVKHLQEFLAKFTEGEGSRQGNAVSDAVIMVEINGRLHEIRRMEVHENAEKVFIGWTGQAKATHRLVLKTEKESKLILPDKLRNDY